MLQWFTVFFLFFQAVLSCQRKLLIAVSRRSLTFAEMRTEPYKTNCETVPTKCQSVILSWCKWPRFILKDPTSYKQGQSVGCPVVQHTWRKLPQKVYFFLWTSFNFTLWKHLSVIFGCHFAARWLLVAVKNIGSSLKHWKQNHKFRSIPTPKRSTAASLFDSWFGTKQADDLQNLGALPLRWFVKFGTRWILRQHGNTAYVELCHVLLVGNLDHYDWHDFRQDLFDDDPFPCCEVFPMGTEVTAPPNQLAAFVEVRGWQNGWCEREDSSYSSGTKNI